VQGSILGPILFSLFISPVYDLENIVTYADDSYVISEGTTKEESLQELTRVLDVVARWFKASGLKVNFEKTEVTVFHRSHTVQETIMLDEEQIQTKEKMSVLGIIFDSKLHWDYQVCNSIDKANKSLQAIRLIKKYFTRVELLTLLTSYFYSRLYFGAQVWLIPSLKKNLKNKLFSASGNALKLLSPEIESFKLLHKMHKRATPTMWQNYQIAIALYDLVLNDNDVNELINCEENLMYERRSDKILFTRNNKYKCGLNRISNRFISITKKLSYPMLDLTKDCFKSRCKLIFINDVLEKL
jgi:hypothetical protein